MALKGATNNIVVRILGDDRDLKDKLKVSGADIRKWSAIAVSAAAVATTALVRSGLKSADAQAKLAAQLRTTSTDLAILERSFDMAGVSQEQLRSGTRQLTNRLAQAAQGTGAAAEALDKLGLSATSLSQMPLSDRINTINEALREQVPVSEQAALAAQIYGEEAGLAFTQVSPETIAAATDQVHRFGAALSAVDAAQIEAANDAIGQGKLAFQGLTQQLAAQFAPVLQGAANELADLVGGTGFFERAAEKAFDIVIKGAGFVADAIRQIQLVLKALEGGFHALRAGSLFVLEQILSGIDHVINGAKQTINELIAGLNRIPGVDIDQLVIGDSAATARIREWQDSAVQSMEETSSEFAEILNRPLPSDALDQWVATVQQSSRVAAEEVAKQREAVMGLNIPEVEEHGPNLTDKEREDMQKRLESLRDSYASEFELIEKSEKEKLELVNEARKADELSAEEHQRLITQIEKEASASRLKIREEEALRAAGAATQMLTDISSIMDKESRKQFEIAKAAAISQTVIDTYKAAQSAYSALAGIPVVGPALGAAAAATAVAAGLARANSISKRSFSKSTGGGDPGAAASSGMGNVSAGGGGGSQQPDRVLRVEGLNPNQLFTGDVVTNLMQQMVSAQKDGVRLVVS